MIHVFDLVRLLADGRFHSGPSLATRFGVSRMTIGHAVKRLLKKGIEIEVRRGHGYRLKARSDLLNARNILEMLDPRTRSLISGVEVLLATGSTNAHLLEQGAAGRPAGQVCLAEMQTAGRGRRGKGWVSPFGANLYMSLLWRFEQHPINIGRLSLFTALAVVDALTALGAQGMALKWPNDVLWQHRKLGGILLETACGAGSRGYVVIGIGLNVRMPEPAGSEIDQPWTDLTTVLSGKVPARNVIAARLLDVLVPVVYSFERSGRSLREAWRRYDSIDGQIVEVQTDSGRRRGKAMGVDGEGRLLLEIDGHQQAFTCGEVSLARGRRQVQGAFHAPKY
jgi:BirA family biotin operon repressor/biotin-[acetyl-CoA-carboxylase] ligase